MNLVPFLTRAIKEPHTFWCVYCPCGWAQTARYWDEAANLWNEHHYEKVKRYGTFEPPSELRSPWGHVRRNDNT